MTITIREQQQFQSNTSGTQAAFTLGAGTTAGDIAVAIHADDYYTAAALTSPGGTAVSSWGTVKYTYDGGTNGSHAKVWVAAVTTGGASTITSTSTHTDEERCFGAWILYDTGNTVSFDNALGTQVAASTAPTAPSVTPAVGHTNDLLLCMWGYPGGGGNDDTYSAFGAMTPYANLNHVGWGSWCFAYQFLASSAATGGRTCTSATNQAHTTLSVLIQTTGGGAAVTKTERQTFTPGLGQAVRRASIW